MSPTEELFRPCMLSQWEEVLWCSSSFFAFIEAAVLKIVIFKTRSTLSHSFSELPFKLCTEYSVGKEDSELKYLSSFKKMFCLYYKVVFRHQQSLSNSLWHLQSAPCCHVQSCTAGYFQLDVVDCPSTQHVLKVFYKIQTAVENNIQNQIRLQREDLVSWAGRKRLLDQTFKRD